MSEVTNWPTDIARLTEDTIDRDSVAMWETILINSSHLTSEPQPGCLD